jgi:hypothetical protein
MANVDMHHRLYRYMKEQKIDKTNWWYSGGNLQDINLCVMDGKDITDEYNYDNDFYLDPIVDMIQQMFLEKYRGTDNRGEISVSVYRDIASDALGKNAIIVSITRVME